MAQSSVVIVEEEDIVEPDKKQVRDDRNKELGGVHATGEQNKNHNPIQIDGNKETIQRYD